MGAVNIGEALANGNDGKFCDTEGTTSGVYLSPSSLSLRKAGIGSYCLVDSKRELESRPLCPLPPPFGYTASCARTSPSFSWIISCSIFFFRSAMAVENFSFSSKATLDVPAWTFAWYTWLSRVTRFLRENRVTDLSSLLYFICSCSTNWLLCFQQIGLLFRSTLNFSWVISESSIHSSNNCNASFTSFVTTVISVSILLVSWQSVLILRSYSILPVICDLWITRRFSSLWYSRPFSVRVLDLVFSSVISVISLDEKILIIFGRGDASFDEIKGKSLTSVPVKATLYLACLQGCLVWWEIHLVLVWFQSS